MTRNSSKRTTKPAAVSAKPVGYKLGYSTHRAASATKRGLKKVGSSTASFFKNIANGWRAA